MKLSRIVWLITISFAQIFPLQITFAAPRPLAPPWPSFGALHHEGFDQPFRFATNQAVDPAVWAESFSGYALQRSGPSVTPWALPMVVSNSIRIEPERGAIRFWYRPDFDSGVGSGQMATLLELVTANGKASEVWWSLVVSPDGSELHLICETESGAESCLQAEVKWEADSWHLLTIGFTPTNSALFIDDQLAAVGDGLAPIPNAAVPYTSLVIGSATSGALPAQGQIEELCLFTGRKKMQQVMGNVFGLSADWDIGLYYASLSKTAALGPISDEEIAERVARAAQRKAAREALGMEEFGGGMQMMMLGGESGECVTNGPAYLTNVVVNLVSTNDGWTIYFDVAGGTNEVVYDLFTTSSLSSTSLWTWLESARTCETHWFTNQPQSQSYYTILTPGQDRDADGIYDGWEWKHFGHLNQSPGDDYDGDGVSNIVSYANYNDPNQIKFALDFGTAHVGGNTATGSVVVLQGVPEYMAVLVDDTNFEAAIWQPYQNNVVANIGATDGEYTVWVGLAGHAWDAERLWHGITITRDTVAPLLVVTNPATSLSLQPLLQLQGYANESLAWVRYDLTNAAGLQTNLTGYITRQWLDTNTLRFTTNWFQCYDVVLETNLNSLTVTIADLAGNVTTTNLSLTLDFSTDTNAPTIAVTWPEENALVAGTNFALRGELDDASASVTVEAGEVSYAASVARNGQFMIASLPLNAPTNQLVIIATDAAGNARTNTHVVRQSSESLTIDSITPGQLTQPTVTLGGTVGVSGQNVWVNGTAADVNGNTWTATIPTPQEGVANFDIQTGSSLSNPTAGQMLSVESPPQARPVSYTENYSRWDSASCGVGARGTIRQREWVLGVGGTSRQDYALDQPAQTCATLVVWPAEWPGNQILPGMISCSDSGYAEQTVYAWQNSVTEEARIRFIPNGDSCFGPYTSREIAQRAAETKIELRAGGSGNDTRLIRLTTHAEAYTDSILNGLSESSLMDFGSYSGPGDTPLPISTLRIFGLTPTPTATNANVGELFITRPAGTTEEIPFTVIGAKDYSFDIQAEEVNATLLADANRDGAINDLDRSAISTANPFRFWINDDTDDGDTEGNDIPGQADIAHNFMDLPMYADYHTAVGSANYEGYGVVDGTRDLIDFFPVYLDITNLLMLLPPSATVQYKLRQPNEAVNVVFTGLNQANALEYQTTYDLAQDVVARNTRKVTSAGLELPADFLDGIVHGTNGVILVEGRAATIHPLELVVEKAGVPIVVLALPLRIGGVELMFRHLNLRDGTDAPSNLPGAPYSGDVGFQSRMDTPPNNPYNLSTGRWLIFVHGYNVSAARSRGWEAEAFKRFYWSGSRARYIGVDWLGNPNGEDVVADYHYAVMNAFQSAAKLAEKLNPLAGSKTIVGHSLGCGVTAFALVDHGLQVNNACLVDAALASECFDGDSAEDLADMAYAPWTQTADPATPNYPRELWAADWYKRFQGGNDARQMLTWNNRFTNALSLIHNFYSSTEDVLGIWPGAPTTVVLENIIQLGGLGNYAWVMQEKTKGNKLQLLGTLNLTGSDYGGWGFNFYDPITANLPTWYVAESSPSPGYRRMKTPAEIGTLTQNLLDGSRYAPLFNSGWGDYDWDFPTIPVVNTFAHSGPEWILDLYHVTNGNTVAADPAKRTQLLAEAIPALSPPAGWQPLVRIPGRNYNMPILYAAAPWPRGPKLGTDISLWRHSDLREVAFLYNSTLFKTIVNVSNQ